MCISMFYQLAVSGEKQGWGQGIQGVRGLFAVFKLGGLGFPKAFISTLRVNVLILLYNGI